MLTSFYTRDDDRSSTGPGPLLMMALTFGMLAAGSAVLGVAAAVLGGMPGLVAMMPALLLLLVAGLLTGLEVHLGQSRP